MPSDKNERADARHDTAGAARTRADTGRARAVAGREADEQGTTEYARRAHHRVADSPGQIARSRVSMRYVEAMRLEVERRMRRGERFTDVEDVINATDLSADEKTALWLLGWSYVHPRAQRRQANAHLASLTAATPPPTIHRQRHLRVAG
jgi:hypothetical protein